MQGPKRLLLETRYRTVNYCFEKMLGVETGGMERPSDLGICNVDSIEYEPIGYSAFFEAIKKIPIPPKSISFVDFGSGKGRAVVAAAIFPFRKITGVEISDSLCEISRKNIRKMRFRHAGKIEIVQSNAVTYALPKDSNLLFFFNPFTGGTLAQVVNNIIKSHCEHDRPIYIVYFNANHFENIIYDDKYKCIRRIYMGKVYPNYSCCIYSVNDNMNCSCI